MADVTPVNGSINLGRQGENIVTRVLLPLSDIRSGDGYAVLFHQRSVDDSPYPVAVEEDGDTLIWTVTDADTAVAGRGKAEMRWIGSHGELAKSQVYKTYVAAALEIPEEVPSGYQKYVDAVAENAKDAKDAAAESRAIYGQVLNSQKKIDETYNATVAAKVKAEEAQEKAELAANGIGTAKDDAAASAETAKGAAIAAKQAAQEAKSAQTGAEEAKTGAETAQGKAEKAAQGIAADREQIGANKSGLEAAQQELTATKEQLAETKAALTTTQKDLAKAQRAIQFQAELNQGQTWDFETDDSVAYSRTVPSGAKAGAVMEISGKTRRGKNVLPLVLSNKEYNTFATVSGAIISVKNTSANTIFPQTEWFELPAGTYCACQSNADVETYFQVKSDDYSNTLKGAGSIVITLDAATPVRYMLSVAAGANVSIAIQTVRGSAPDYDFEPYTQDLLSAQVDEARVAGKNVARPMSAVSKSGITMSVDKNGVYHFSGTATGAFSVTSERFDLPGGTYTVSIDAATPNNVYLSISSITQLMVGTNTVKTGKFGGGMAYVYLYIAKGTVMDNVSIAFQVERGSTHTDYVPYREPTTLPIPDAVKSLPGYGWSAGSVANTIERTENGWQYVQRVGSVDLGELSWSINESVTYGSKYFASNSIVNPTKAPAFLTAGYTAMDSANVLATDMACWITFNWVENGRVIIRDDKYADVASFKSAMSGKPLYYELATPITTDITALMGDSLAPFAVESGGSITLHHPKADEGFAIDVPVKVQYITKLSEVSANG